jgi:hypothetical protein
MISGVNGRKMESGGFNQTGSSSNGATVDLTEERKNSCYLEAKESVFTTPPKIHRRILKFNGNMNDDKKEMDLTR